MLYFHRRLWFCSRGRGVCLSACWDTPPLARQTPLAQCMLGDTVNKRALCILLECNSCCLNHFKELSKVFPAESELFINIAFYFSSCCLNFHHWWLRCYFNIWVHENTTLSSAANNPFIVTMCVSLLTQEFTSAGFMAHILSWCYGKTSTTNSQCMHAEECHS